MMVLFGDIISFLLIALYTIMWFKGVLGDHDCELVYFWLILGLVDR
mgnify:CR=1 FL=1